MGTASIPETADHLAFELSEAMGSYLNGQFFALVAPEGKVSFHPRARFTLALKPSSPKDRLNKAIAELKAACAAICGDGLTPAASLEGKQIDALQAFASGSEQTIEVALDKLLQDLQQSIALDKEVRANGY